MNHHCPSAQEVQEACEILSLDPLYVANKGKLLTVVAKEDVDSALEAIRTESKPRLSAK